jgi:repressor LexA
MMTRDKDMDARLHKIMEFLTGFQETSGYSPSIREIGDKIGVNSTSLVDFYLDKLEERGDINREKHISRSIRVNKPIQSLANVTNKMQKGLQAVSAVVSDLIRIPLAGRIVASAPVPVPESDVAYFDPESSIEIARGMLPARENEKNLFALEVQGDSMVDAMVNDGDIVIMKTASEASNGDMVAVWLDDNNETTLKYYYKESGRVRLQPANPTMQPIYIDPTRHLRIMGKVVLVIRQVKSIAA